MNLKKSKSKKLSAWIKCHCYYYYVYYYIILGFIDFFV